MGRDLQRGYTPLERELEGIGARLRRWTVQVQGRQPGGGSGIIWRSTGVVITNAHVARGPSATVTLSDGRIFEAAVAARDAELDVAMLMLQASDLPSASIGDSGALRVGELVIAVGNPLGIVGALTAGIIHALSPADGAYGQRWLQADIRLAPGNSGGPLADAQGRIIGLNSMVVGGLAFALPSNAVERFLHADGRRPILGVTVRGVSMPLEGQRVLGLLVLGVAAGGAAEAGGILIGDVLIGIDGQLFGDPQDLSRALRHVETRGRLSIDLIRGGQRTVCEVAVSANTSGMEAA
ncbi:MAG TPA: trypsin-like peptidase domain-containing protein [Candidatus Tectomicrobia bacterium]|nr:trypsin-like peptidase domain-containing protein [Candidatus Tectomicrobia bacterium]